MQGRLWILLLAGECHAGMRQMLRTAHELAKHANITRAQSRKFFGFVKSKFADIDNYGCWCYLNDGLYASAGGAVQDSVDNRCKNLIQGYRCIIADAQGRGETCDPQTVTYYGLNEIIAADPQADAVAQCTTNNPDSTCAKEACIVEGTFVLEFLSEFFNPDGVTFDPSFVHLENSYSDLNGGELIGTFNPRTECCPLNDDEPSKMILTDYTCGGTHPTRYPYVTADITNQASCVAGDVKVAMTGSIRSSGSLSFGLTICQDETCMSEYNNLLHGAFKVGHRMHFRVEHENSQFVPSNLEFSLLNCWIFNHDLSQHFKIVDDSCPIGDIDMQFTTDNKDKSRIAASFQVFEFIEDAKARNNNPVKLQCQVVMCNADDANSTCNTGCQAGDTLRKRRSMVGAVSKTV